MSNNSLETMSLAQENTWNLSEICVGMNEDQVLKVMRHPYTKKRVMHQGIVYDIWFYITKQTGLGQSRLVAQNLTPLTFENGVLKGWGFVYYHRVLEKIERSETFELKAPVTPAKTHPTESKSLENAIENTEKPTLEKKNPPISFSSQPKPKDPKKDKPQTDKEKKSEERKEKRDEAIQQDNEQNFDFW
jgi:hypothetical protein